MIWGFLLGGLLLTGLCGYTAWWLISLLLRGIFSNNWPMIVGGRILLYLFIGIMLVGMIMGVAGLIIGVTED